jgi:hypothetical protein
MKRFEHHHVIAKSGAGKTTLYEHMVSEDLELVARGDLRPENSSKNG